MRGELDRQYETNDLPEVVEAARVILAILLDDRLDHSTSLAVPPGELSRVPGGQVLVAGVPRGNGLGFATRQTRPCHGHLSSEKRIGRIRFMPSFFWEQCI